MAGQVRSFRAVVPSGELRWFLHASNMFHDSMKRVGMHPLPRRKGAAAVVSNGRPAKNTHDKSLENDMPEMDVTKWIVLVVFAAIIIFFAFNCTVDKDPGRGKKDSEEPK